MKKFVVLAFLVSAGCASYEKDLATMCNAPSAVDLSKAQDPALKAQLLAAHIEKNVKSREGKQLFEGFASMDAASRPEILAAEAKKAGIEKCELVEVWSHKEASYAEDLQAICSANDFSAIESIAAVTDSGRNLVRTLANMGESSRAEVLHREVTQHRVMPCDVIDTK